MAQNSYINPNQIPRPTGGSRQDMERLSEYLFRMVEELQYRLQDAERRLRELEGKKKK